MSTDVKARFGSEVVTQFSSELKEPEWIRQMRLKAIDAYPNLDLPALEKTKLTNWNIDQFSPYKYERSISSLDELPDDVKELVSTAQGRNILIQKNSSVIFQDTSEEIQKQGVIFTDLHTALEKHEDLVKKYFAQSIKWDEHKLTALHYALWNGGVFVYVPRNVEVELPLQAMYWAAEEEVGLLPHILIVAEDNSSVTYVDNYFSTRNQKPAVHNGLVEVFVGQNARVRFASVRTMDQDMTDYIIRRAVVGRDGSIEWLLGEMNDGNTVSDNTSLLKGDGSKSLSRVVSIGTGDQKQNITSRAMHDGKHSDSNMLAKGVMKDAATSIFNGITKIEKGASKSNGEQAENVLMLSEKARGDANPILLIDEDDVTAGHAASVGQINEMQMYYLMSRGISKEEAEQLIIRGFLAPVVADIPLDSVKERLEQAIERKLAR
ncbi:MAG: Fe-S cluster assembly protein SufD [Bacillaceae bacterium]|nr:Fe-S cluster assembly protein SufD [Bacillaceae bacterium]